MGIRFQCEHCQHALNLKSDLAGKKGICPKCKGKIRIPLESAVSVSEADSELLESEALSAEASAPPSAGELYWVCPPTGGCYGPADRRLLLEWARQERITKDCLLVEVPMQASASQVITSELLAKGVRADIVLADFYHQISYRLPDYSISVEKPVDFLAQNSRSVHSKTGGVGSAKPGVHATIRAKRTRTRNRNLVIVCLMVATAVLLLVAIVVVLNRK
jgi:hypothetical protein